MSCGWRTHMGCTCGCRLDGRSSDRLTSAAPGIDPGSVPWREGDVAAGDALRVCRRSVNAAPPEQLGEDDAHLELGERGAEAAADAAAERDPAVRGRPLLEEALGTERVGLGI